LINDLLDILGISQVVMPAREEGSRYGEEGEVVGRGRGSTIVKGVQLWCAVVEALEGGSKDSL
jgi:hypothetical protein